MTIFSADEFFGGSSTSSIPDWLDSALEWQESRGNQNAVSPKGAFGVRQLMPATAQDPGFGIKPLDFNAPDPEAENRRLGRDYLGKMLERYNGDETRALVAYNWGPGNADKWNGDVNRLPRETRQYVSNITSRRPMTLGPSEAPPAAPEGAMSAEDFFGPEGFQPEKPYEPTPWGDIGDDSMNSVISGGIGGLTQLAGLPGDIVKGLSYANDQLGFATVDEGSVADKVGTWLKDNLSSEALSNVETPLGRVGDAADYTPKTGAGEILQPAAAIAAGGPLLGKTKGPILGAGTGRKALEVLGGATAGEAGEQQFGPVGGLVANVIATHKLGKPVAAGKMPTITAKDVAKSEADMVTSPGTEAIKRKSQEIYAKLDNSGIKVDDNAFYNFQRSLEKDPELASLGYKPQEHTRLAGMLDSIKTQIKGGHTAPMTGLKGGPIGWERFDDMRQQVGKIARTATSVKERTLAGHVINRMDDFFEGAVGKAPAKLASEARKNWRTYRKSELMDEMFEGVKDKTNRFSVSGEENAVVDVFRQLSTKITKDKRTRNLFSRDEIKLIRSLSRGWRTRNMLKHAGRFLNSNVTRVGGAGLAGAAAIHDDVDPSTALLGAAAGYLGGQGARYVSGKMAMGAAKNLRKVVQSGGELTQPSNPLVTGLLQLNQYLGQ